MQCLSTIGKPGEGRLNYAGRGFEYRCDLLFNGGQSNVVDNLVLKITQPNPKPQQNPNKTLS